MKKKNADGGSSAIQLTSHIFITCHSAAKPSIHECSPGKVWGKPEPSSEEDLSPLPGTDIFSLYQTVPFSREPRSRPASMVALCEHPSFDIHYWDGLTHWVQYDLGAHNG